MGHYVMVGLASRRILLHHNTDHMVAQVLRLQQPHGGETSMRVSLANVNPLEFQEQQGIICYLFVLSSQEPRPK